MYAVSTLDWFDVPLVYSDHAIQRAEERDMKIYSYLPVSSELIKTKEDGSCTFRFIEGDMYVVLVLIKGGRVLTTYFNGYVTPKVKEVVKKVRRKKIIRGKVKEYKFEKYPFLEIQSQIYDYA
jgi:hypothetical protein